MENDGPWRTFIRSILGKDWYESDGKKRFDEKRLIWHQVLFWSGLVIAILWLAANMGPF